MIKLCCCYALQTIEVLLTFLFSCSVLAGLMPLGLLSHSYFYLLLIIVQEEDLFCRRDDAERRHF